MIRVTRLANAEPQALRDARTTRLPVAQAHHLAGTLDTDKHLIGYDDARDVLHAAQHYKCCYCEKLVPEASFNDVEHYRPKSVYWWLTWTWDNLMFACPDCNRSGKNDSFPVAPHSTPLAPMAIPPGSEVPWLIDPANSAIDPLQLIEFKRTKKGWWPTARNGSVEGRETIRVLKLDRQSLRTQYDLHVEDHVAPFVAEVRKAMDGGMQNLALVTERWEEGTSRLLHCRRPFLGLTWDALQELLAPTAWVAFGLRSRLRRPPL